MRFFDVDKIQANLGLSNKYLLTSVVAIRARKLSEDRSNLSSNDSFSGEKFITVALSELEKDRLYVTFDIPGIEGGESVDDLEIEEE